MHHMTSFENRCLQQTSPWNQSKHDQVVLRHPCPYYHQITCNPDIVQNFLQIALHKFKSKRLQFRPLWNLHSIVDELPKLNILTLHNLLLCYFLNLRFHEFVLGSYIFQHRGLWYFWMFYTTEPYRNFLIRKRFKVAVIKYLEWDSWFAICKPVCNWNYYTLGIHQIITCTSRWYPHYCCL